MADSEETPVLLIHTHGETVYKKIYDLLVAFCFFVLACFICGLFIMRNEFQQIIQRTIAEEFDKILKKLFPGGPGNGGDDDDKDNSNNDNVTNSDNQDETDVRPPRGSNARLILADLEKKDNQKKGNISKVFSGNQMTAKRIGYSSQSRQTTNSLRCGSCGLYPYASDREHDEIFPKNASPKENRGSYFGGTSIALSSGMKMEMSNEGTFEIYEVLPSSEYNNANSITNPQFSRRGYGLQDSAMFGNDIVSHTMNNRFTEIIDPQRRGEYLNYLGGMIHNREDNGNDASNNARIDAYNRRNKRLWEEITDREELYTSFNYFPSGRNCP